MKSKKRPAPPISREQLIKTGPILIGLARVYQRAYQSAGGLLITKMFLGDIPVVVIGVAKAGQEHSEKPGFLSAMPIAIVIDSELEKYLEEADAPEEGELAPEDEGLMREIADEIHKAEFAAALERMVEQETSKATPFPPDRGIVH
jgi:hypothetical protein